MRSHIQLRNIYLICTMLFGVSTWITGNVAARHTSGQLLEGTYQLQLGATTIFYWVIFGVSFLCFLASVWAFVLNLSTKREYPQHKSSLPLHGGAFKAHITSTVFHKS